MKQIRFFDLIDSFIDDLRSVKGYSDHTAKNYRIDLEQFLSFLVEKQDLFGKAETSPELESVDSWSSGNTWAGFLAATNERP